MSATADRALVRRLQAGRRKQLAADARENRRAWREWRKWCKRHADTWHELKLARESGDPKRIAKARRADVATLAAMPPRPRGPRP